MKLSNLGKLILLFVILLVTGCSARLTTSVANTPTNESKITTTLPPFTGKIAFVSSRNGKFDVFVMNADGSHLENLTDNLTLSYEPAWSPNGQYIAFTSSINGTNQVLSMKADGSDQQQLTFDKAQSYQPTWSPDGKRIMFLSDRDDILSDKGVPVSEVYVMNADGSEQRRLINSQDFIRELAWSPTRDIIAATINRTDPFSGYQPEEIYLMAPDGTIIKQLTDFSRDNYNPVWSLDGKFIVFASQGNGESDICVMKANGIGQICLIKSINTNSSTLYVNNLFPAWSPDGRYIVFSSNRDGLYHLYIIKADGSDLARLTNEAGDEIAPAWSPVP